MSFRTAQQQPTFRRPLRAAAALGVLALTAAGVHAHSSTATGPGLYAGASLGAPRYSDSIAGVGTGGDGVAGKAYLGYALTPYVSLEGTLADLGRVDGGPGRVRSKAGSVDVVGTLPLNTQLSVLGRIGAARVRTSTPTGTDTGNGLKLGLGAEYALTPSVALRGEWERYRPDVFGDKPNIDQYTVGVKYRF